MTIVHFAEGFWSPKTDYSPAAIRRREYDRGLETLHYATGLYPEDVADELGPITYELITAYDAALTSWCVDAFDSLPQEWQELTGLDRADFFQDDWCGNCGACSECMAV